MKQYELLPAGNDKAKSFYGKAVVCEDDNGDLILQSYSTKVCKVTKSGEFVRMWSGYSVTTMRHVNSFLKLQNIPGGGKSWWRDQPVGV